MSNSVKSGGTDLKAFCSTVYELNDQLRFMKLSKQILYKNTKHEGSVLQGSEFFGFDPQKYVLSFKHVFIPQGIPMHFKLNTCLSALLDQGQSIFSIF